MGKFIPMARYEASPRQDSRQAGGETRPPVRRRQTEPMRATAPVPEMSIPRDPRQQLWVFSLAAVRDGLVEFHCHYGLAIDEETAGEMAIDEAVDLYPKEEGYGQHTIAIQLLPKARLLAIARAVL